MMDWIMSWPAWAIWVLKGYAFVTALSIVGIIGFHIGKGDLRDDSTL